MTKGLFQVKSAKSLMVEGTAFAVHRENKLKLYYVVTAYHVIAEIVAKDDDILLTDEDGRTINAVYRLRRKTLIEYESVENDYAVLEVNCDRDYEVYDIKDYTRVPKSTKCSIEGAIAHFNHPFTPFTALYEGTVRNNEKDILFINNLSNEFTGHNKQPLSTQNIFKGLSGAPVVALDNGKEFCIGILTQVGDDFQTPVRYAVPIMYAVKSITGLDIKIDENLLSTISAGDYLDAIFDNDFEFSDDKADKQIWNKLSNAHFRSGNIDKKLNRIIQSDDFREKSAEIQCAVLYYYARLLFKRGRIDEARLTLLRIKDQSRSMSAKSYKKINALVESRQIVENTELRVYKPHRILKAADKLGESLENSKYRAYEMASVYGRGIMNLFQEVSDLNESEKKEVLCIYNNQKELHKKYPKALKKQEVVITSVEWFIELWNVSNNICIDDIDDTIREGFIQAKKLCNNIFHVQCLLSMVISLLIKEKKAASTKVFYTVSKLMHKLNITFRNEGISQLIKYIMDNYYPFYTVFIYIHNNIDADTCELFPKLDTFLIAFDNGSWKSILEESFLLYSRLYENSSIGDKSIQPYDVDYTDLFHFYI